MEVGRSSWRKREGRQITQCTLVLYIVHSYCTVYTRNVQWLTSSMEVGRSSCRKREGRQITPTLSQTIVMATWVLRSLLGSEIKFRKP